MIRGEIAELLHRQKSCLYWAEQEGWTPTQAVFLLCDSGHYVGERASTKESEMLSEGHAGAHMILHTTTAVFDYCLELLRDEFKGMETISPREALRWAWNNEWCKENLDVVFWIRFIVVPPDYEHVAFLERWKAEHAVFYLAGLELLSLKETSEQGEEEERLYCAEKKQTVVRKLRDLMFQDCPEGSEHPPGVFINWARRTPWCQSNLDLTVWDEFFHQRGDDTSKADSEKGKHVERDKELECARKATMEFLDEDDLPITRESLKKYIKGVMKQEGLESIHSENSSVFRTIWREACPENRKYKGNPGHADINRLNLKVEEMLTKRSQ